jgi:hypothetical protein
MAKSKKKPHSKYKASVQKEPKHTVTLGAFHGRNPAWRLNKLKKYNDYEFGWDAIEEDLSRVMELLHDFETRTWGEILINDRKRNHPVSIYKLIPKARRMLAQQKEDVDEIVSLHLSSKERIWGIMESEYGIMDIVWWDPEHKICPSEKKHT